MFAGSLVMFVHSYRYWLCASAPARASPIILQIDLVYLCQVVREEGCNRASRAGRMEVEGVNDLNKSSCSDGCKCTLYCKHLSAHDLVEL